MLLVKKILKWIPSCIVLCLSFYLSSQSQISQMPTFPYADKVVHLIFFTILSFCIAFSCNVRGNRFYEIILPTVLVVVYSFVDEFHQSFVPMRDVSIGDLVFDFLGAFIGSCMFYFLMKFVVKRIKASIGRKQSL
jgi:VanZ family protein